MLSLLLDMDMIHNLIWNTGLLRTHGAQVGVLVDISGLKEESTCVVLLNARVIQI